MVLLTQMNGGVLDKVIGNSAPIGINYFSDRFNIESVSKYF